ncbi:MAG: hypothetical protein L5656_11115 [Thermanaeromonas sp.]|uniref:YwgA family protein n=1 Tax=Thermanaeromonas sp. TaxID=2003697 RepID=UPI00243DBE2A|nr:hypothetical protein [Thermanaeromonas sp.]MCG0279051.1 hypothetical protein [Thermanaeromonas sp.]
MDILSKYRMLMMLLSAVGQIHGRKKLQKMVYLLQEAGCPFKEEFNYHLYGPYSEELAIKVDEMKFLGLLEERIEATTSGYKQYIYSLSDLGRQYLAATPKNTFRIPPYFEQFAKELARYDARTLELMATLRFLRKMNYSDSEASEYVKILKPEQEYKDDEIRNALDFLNKLSGTRTPERA